MSPFLKCDLPNRASAVNMAEADLDAAQQGGVSFTVDSDGRTIRGSYSIPYNAQFTLDRFNVASANYLA